MGIMSGNVLNAGYEVMVAPAGLPNPAVNVVRICQSEPNGGGRSCRIDKSGSECGSDLPIRTEREDAPAGLPNPAVNVVRICQSEPNGGGRSCRIAKSGSECGSDLPIRTEREDAPAGLPNPAVNAVRICQSEPSGGGRSCRIDKSGRNRRLSRQSQTSALKPAESVQQPDCV